MTLFPQRYFVGIAPPLEYGSQIAAIQRDLGKRHDVPSPLPPHITLLHPGALSEISKPAAFDHTLNVARRTLPMAVIIPGFGIFGERVLHLRAESSALAPLHSDLTAILPGETRDRYYNSSRRSFRPHMTIVQAPPKETLPTEVVDEYMAAVQPLLPITFTADRLTIFTEQGERLWAPEDEILLQGPTVDLVPAARPDTSIVLSK